MSADELANFPKAGHDHDRCVEDAMEYAAKMCTGRGARLTALRARVLEIIWQSHKPLGAYGILEILSKDGRSPSPPTVYRALEFLLEQGLVHRIASLNAFVGCREPGHTMFGQFLICEICGDAAELTDARIDRAIARAASSQGFSAQNHTVEVSGRCPNCREKRP